MLRTLFRIVAVAAGLGLAARAAAAQMHEHGCDLCAPQLSIDAGALLRSAAVLPAGTSDRTTPLVRARLEVETPAPHLGLFGTMEFTRKTVPRRP